MTVADESVRRLRDTGFGWPLYGDEPTDWTEAPGWLDVRTETQVADDEAARWLVASRSSSLNPQIRLSRDHPCGGAFDRARLEIREEVQAIVHGGLAPTRGIAVALARLHMDPYDQFLRNITPERGAYLAGLVLDAYAANHPDRRSP